MLPVEEWFFDDVPGEQCEDDGDDEGEDEAEGDVLLVYVISDEYLYHGVVVEVQSVGDVVVVLQEVEWFAVVCYGNDYC